MIYNLVPVKSEMAWKPIGQYYCILFYDWILYFHCILNDIDILFVCENCIVRK